MNPMTVTLIILETIKLGSTILEEMNKGEITPEEATKRWQDIATDWDAAVDRWKNT